MLPSSICLRLSQASVTINLCATYISGSNNIIKRTMPWAENIPSWLGVCYGMRLVSLGTVTVTFSIVWYLCSTVVRKVEHPSDIRLVTNIPHFVLLGEIYGVYIEGMGENRPSYNSTELCVTAVIRIQIFNQGLMWLEHVWLIASMFLWDIITHPYQYSQATSLPLATIIS